MANVEIPQSSEDSFAAQRGSLTQHLGEDLRLIARGFFIAVVDAFLVLLFGTGSYPGGEISRVLVQQVVDTLLQSPAHHGVRLSVEAGGQHFQCAATDFRL